MENQSPLRFTILASGSTGNATLIACGTHCILLDAGLSVRKLEQWMIARDKRPEQISHIFITHEHTDHVRGLGAFVRKYGTPIYANANTWRAVEPLIGEVRDDIKHVLHTGETIQLGEMTVESFPISHDAAEPVAYNFHANDKKLCIATDMGYMSPAVRQKAAQADVLVIESNHDIGMLRAGRYPWNVKRRILGDQGHLSNEAAGEALLSLLAAHTKRVYLAHLSQEHNMQTLAMLTVQTILQENGIHSENVQLMHTYAHEATLWDTVG